MEQAFLQAIKRSRRRVLLGRLVGWLSDSLVFSLLATVAFGTWADTAGLGPTAWIFFWLGLGIVLILHLLRECTRETSLRAVAVRLDRELGFRDRISSALAFSQEAELSGFMRAHLVETAEFLEENGQQAVDIPWPGRVRALVVFVLIGLASLLPHADRSQIEAVERSQHQAMRQKAGRDLVQELGRLRQGADLAGLKRLSEVVADAQEFISRKIDLVEPEDLEPPPEEEQPGESDLSVSSSQEDSPEDALKMGSNAIASGVAGQGVRLSHVASYQPVGKFDAFPSQTYAEVFAELDEAIIGDDFLTAKELENLTEHMDDVSGKFSNFGFLDDSRASGLEGAMRQPRSSDMDPESEYDGMERNISGLQMKAFSEFIKRYSSHLGEKALGRAHFEETQKGKRAKGGEVLDLSAAPPPKDAEFALTGVSDKSSGAPMVQGSAEQMAEMAAKTLANGQVSGADAKPGSIKVRGGGTAPGGRGAGMGAGAGQGVAAPKILPRASGGEYLPLEGKLSDGKSVVRLIDAQGRRSLGVQSGKSDDGLTYQEVFVEYAHGAEAELNGEQVPVHMRDYIREYFRSIRPKAP